MTRDYHKYLGVELGHLREVCSEFARQHPKVAERIDLGEDPQHLSRDPYVNLLMEASASLSAMVHQELDAEFPRLVQALLDLIHPLFLCPVPSMAIVNFTPRPGDPSLAKGVTIPRHTVLQSLAAKGERTVCTFRTAHPVELWPFSLSGVEYVPRRGLGRLELPEGKRAAAALRLSFRADPGITFQRLAAGEGDRDARSGPPGLDRIVLNIRDDGKGYLRGPGSRASMIYEQFFRLATEVVVQAGPEARSGRVPAEGGLPRIARVGFSPEEALLPTDERSPQGYRLLREYFSFPERFLFVAFEGLNAALMAVADEEVTLTVLLKEEQPELGNLDVEPLSTRDFSLFATPCINLFEQDFSRVRISDRESEYAVHADSGAKREYEIYSLSRVTGYGRGDERRAFRPLYSVTDADEQATGFYVVHRRPTVASRGERAFGRMPGYLGTDVFVSIVDPLAAPYSPNLRHLGFRGLCSNRGLGRRIPVGHSFTDFVPADFSGPFLPEIRCQSPPTPPMPPPLEGNLGWRLMNHLAFSHRPLLERSAKDAAEVLRQHLRIYVDESRPHTGAQLEALSGLTVSPRTLRVPVPGPVTYARGLEIRLTFDEDRVPGTGLFLLGAVLEEFLQRQVSLNSFITLILSSTRRGDLVQWPARFGGRPLL